MFDLQHAVIGSLHYACYAQLSILRVESSGGNIWHCLGRGKNVMPYLGHLWKQCEEGNHIFHFKLCFQNAVRKA